MPVNPTLDPHDVAVVVLAPTGRDGALAGAVLAEEGFDAIVCRNMDALCHEIEAGAGAVLVAEEALAPPAGERLAAVLSRQPPWSDLPVVLFSGGGTSEEAGRRTLAAIAPFDNVTVLDRPVRVVSLVSALRAALRARRRQYQVRELVERLARGVRDRDHFMAMLGHELRNPLAAITFALDFLRRAGDEDEARRRRREVIDRQTRQLTRLVDDLLDASRLTTGKVTLIRAPVELVPLLAGCVESLQAMARAQRVDLELTPTAEPIAILGDAVRLQQIATNLIINALKYTPAGGRVRVAVRRASVRAEIVVEDTGVGLAPGMLQRIFEPFTQVGGEIDRSRGGLGLGLTLVRSLVELHGGAVRAESEGLGRGSRFTIHLPLPKGPLSANAPVPSTPSRQRRTRHVVIIEDNADVRDGLSALVTSHGHTVVVAEDGPSGVTTALGAEPDVVFVDLGLPGLDGFEVARAIRAALGECVLLAAVSGYGAPEDQRRSREAGFDAHLIKPVTAESVEQLLEGQLAALPGALAS
jgi:signal transduction histidine kinase/CheY-like chemotaxis protein